VCHMGALERKVEAHGQGSQAPLLITASGFCGTSGRDKQNQDKKKLQKRDRAAAMHVGPGEKRWNPGRQTSVTHQNQRMERCEKKKALKKAHAGVEDRTQNAREQWLGTVLV